MSPTGYSALAYRIIKAFRRRVPDSRKIKYEYDPEF